MQHDHIQIFSFQANPQAEDVFTDIICACIVLYALFPLVRYAIWLLSEKKNVLTFDPTPGAEGMCKDRICACMVHYAPFPSNLICNMTTIRKKLTLVTMLLNASLPLIWYATWPYSENVEFGYLPHPWPPGGGTQTFDLKSRLICFIVYMRNFINKLLQNWNIWPSTPHKGSGGGVKF